MSTDVLVFLLQCVGIVGASAAIFVAYADDL